VTSASRWHSDVSLAHASDGARPDEAEERAGGEGDAWPRGRAPRGVASHFAERLADVGRRWRRDGDGEEVADGAQ